MIFSKKGNRKKIELVSRPDEMQGSLQHHSAGGQGSGRRSHHGQIGRRCHCRRLPWGDGLVRVHSQGPSVRSLLGRVRPSLPTIIHQRHGKAQALQPVNQVDALDKKMPEIDRSFQMDEEDVITIVIEV